MMASIHGTAARQPQSLQELYQRGDDAISAARKQAAVFEALREFVEQTSQPKLHKLAFMLRSLDG